MILFIIFITSCSEDRQEFTVWIGGAPQEVNFWEELIAGYNQNHEIKVTLVRQPTYSDQRRQSLIISLEAEQKNPDLFLMDVIWVNQFAESDWIEPLNKYIAQSSLSIDDFFSAIVNQVDIYNDTLYALPVFLDIGLLYYRTDLLKKYGFEKPPETWNELKNIALKIQSAEKSINNNFSGYVWQGAQYEGLVCTFLEFAASNNGYFQINDSVFVNIPENEEALQFMQNLIQKYNISPRNTYTELKEEEVRRIFQRGNAMFERNWTYARSLHNLEDSRVKGKFDIAPLPHFEGGKSAATLGGWHVGISKYSDVKEEAWDFIEYITSYEVQKKMFTTIGWNPSRKDIYSDTDLLAENPHLKTLEEIFTNSVSRPTLPYYLQISEVIQRWANKSLAGKSGAKEALREMQNEINIIEEIYAN